MDKLTVTWFLKGNKLLQSNYNIQIDSYGSEHQLRIQSVSQADIGQYTCYAESLCGEVSTTALLKLRGKITLFKIIIHFTSAISSTLSYRHHFLEDNYENVSNVPWKEYFYNNYSLYDEIGK